MSSLARVRAVQPLGGRILRVTFTDGLVRELDFDGALGGVLQSIDNDATFAAVSVDDVAGTVTWPGGIDLDPDVLHGDHVAVSGIRPRLVREYRMQQANP